MNQKTFRHIINTGQPVQVTPDLMAAARESANRERSAAIRAAMGWVKRTGVRLVHRNQAEAVIQPSIKNCIAQVQGQTQRQWTAS